jgi:hypothetical protein
VRDRTFVREDTDTAGDDVGARRLLRTDQRLQEHVVGLVLGVEKDEPR